MFDLMSAAIRTVKAFRRDDSGIALVEYLILLAILSGSVVVAIFIFANNIGIQWQSWALWFSPANLSNVSGGGG